MATRTETMFASSFYTSLIKCPVTINNLIKHFLLPRVLNNNVGTSPAPQSSGRLFKRELGGNKPRNIEYAVNLCLYFGPTSKIEI